VHGRGALQASFVHFFGGPLLATPFVATRHDHWLWPTGDEFFNLFGKQQ
jgi:hypothetical protein